VELTRAQQSRFATAVAACLAIAGGTLPARANGAFPDAQSVIVPADRPHEITLATNFGLISSSDDAQSWTWVCESDATNNGYLYQVGPPPLDRLFALSGDGKLAFSDDRACTWTIAGGATLSGSAVDLFPDPLDTQRVLAIVSPNGKLGGQTTYTLVETHDGGKTFDLLLTAAKSQLFTGVEVARRDTKTIYVTSTTPPDFAPVLIRSDSSGAWQTIALTGLVSTDTRLVAVDPGNTNKIFLRATTANGEALAVVDDAGGTVETPVVLEGGRLTAFVHLAAGAILVAGETPQEPFLYRSTDEGLTFTRLTSAPHLRALAERDGIVWGAADNKADGYALVSSANAGDTWQPVMRFQQVTAINACVKASCQSSCVNELDLVMWPKAICGSDPLPPLADASPPEGGQAGTPMPIEVSGRSGCACGMVAVHRHEGATGALLVLALLARRKRGVARLTWPHGPRYP